MNCASSLYGMCRDDRSGIELATVQACEACLFFREQQAACVHRGSRRLCCDELYLCKQFPGESCTPGVSHTQELRSCLTCDLFEPITNEAA